MLAHSKSDQKSLFGNVKCCICQNNIRGAQKIIRAGLHYGFICSKFFTRFSKEEVELMINMFIAYGGYFGKLKNSRTSTYKRVKILKEEIEKNRNNMPTSVLDIRIIHKALLYGIPSNQFINIDSKKH